MGCCSKKFECVRSVRRLNPPFQRSAHLRMCRKCAVSAGLNIENQKIKWREWCGTGRWSTVHGKVGWILQKHPQSGWNSTSNIGDFPIHVPLPAQNIEETTLEEVRRVVLCSRTTRHRARTTYQENFFSVLVKHYLLACMALFVKFKYGGRKPYQMNTLKLVDWQILVNICLH